MIRKLVSTLFMSTFALSKMAAISVAAEKTAVFAGGCFWCIEKDFEKVKGVKEVYSGYTGGESTNPTYKNHTAQGHREAVRIIYDDTKTSYARLLDIFWRSVDPTDKGGQFCDRGFSYSTAIYALDDAQLAAAKASKNQIDQSGILGKPIVTEITTAKAFTDSEDYHQDYAKKNKLRYRYYRFACGRDKAVKKLWGNQAYLGIHKSS